MRAIVKKNNTTMVNPIIHSPKIHTAIMRQSTLEQNKFSNVPHSRDTTNAKQQIREASIAISPTIPGRGNRR